MNQYNIKTTIICQVSVSNLTTRNDRYRKNALEVNQHLKVLCREKNNIIDQGNNVTVPHLNDTKLHLNLKGNKVLTEKLTEAVSNILHLQILFHSLRKVNDDSYSFRNCDEYNAITKHSLINIRSLKDIC